MREDHEAFIQLKGYNNIISRTVTGERTRNEWSSVAFICKLKISINSI